MRYSPSDRKIADQTLVDVMIHLKFLRPGAGDSLVNGLASREFYDAYQRYAEALETRKAGLFEGRKK